MRQFIAVIVASCLLISSCSVKNVKLNNDLPKIEYTTGYNVKPEPIQWEHPVIIDSVEINCIAKGIYYEARGESIKGKEAVGWVIINRTQNSKYPSTACGVVKQVDIIHGKKFCQFSWYCQTGESKLHSIINNPAYNESYRIAYNIVTGMLDNWLPHAISFHVSTVNASWRRNGMVKVTQIGNHIFYRYKKDS